MSSRKHFECDSCEAVFNIKHDMDDEYYQVQHCPFCGVGFPEDDDECEYDLDEE